MTEERAAAYVVDTLSAAGIECDVVEPAPGRCSVFARHVGLDRSLPALLVHGHLDVVPAQSEGWEQDPFGGEEVDGCLWGRGAVDMKDAVAMMLAIQVEMAQSQVQPRRDLIFTYFADEEMGGVLGSRWIVDHRPELFEGAAEAIGELGGFTVPLPDGRRLYPIQTAEKGTLWFRIRVPGEPGHAALSSGVNPVARLGPLIQRISGLTTDDPPPDAFLALVQQVGQLLRRTQDTTSLLKELGPFGGMALQASRTTFVPTIVNAGSKINVIPDCAEVWVDCRFVPGGEEAARTALLSVLDHDMTGEFVGYTPGLISPLDGALVTACQEAIRTDDPEAIVAPFGLAAGTDAQNLAGLGIRGYGFTPLILPSHLDYPSLFHAPNERIPIDSLIRGKNILQGLVLTY
jgi:acetylornithine deacetylase/succinyl-diaminopimelate desuccinylase-like protein